MLSKLNPWAMVLCYNSDADERDERYIPRWMIWFRPFMRGYGSTWYPVR